MFLYDISTSPSLRQELRPAARAVFDHTDCNVFQAWRKVCRQRPAATALHEALLRLGIMNGCTTSGVEQTFAKQSQIFTKHRRKMHASLECDETVLAGDLVSEECRVVSDEKICLQAARIWLRLRYEMKIATARRVTKGLKRTVMKKNLGKMSAATATQWKLRAREQLSKAMKQRGLRDVSSLERSIRLPCGHAGWSSAHEEELAFQKNKLLEKKMQASQAGLLLDAEERTIAADKPKWLKRQAQNTHKEALKAKRLSDIDLTADRQWKLADVLGGQVRLSENYVCR